MVRFWAVFAAVIVMSTCIGFMPQGIGVMYYMLLVFLAIFKLFHGPIRVDCKLLLLVFVCGVSILLSKYGEIFNSTQRFLAWLLLLMVVTPILSTKRDEEFRMLLFKDVLISCVVITVVSFVCYFLHINFARVQTNSLDFSEVHFGGITTHSMILAPISAIAGLFAIYLLSLPTKNKRQEFFVVLLTFISFATCVIAASRGTLVALLSASLYLIYKTFSRKRKMYFFVGLLLVLFFTYDLWGDFTYRLVKKQEYNVSEGGTFYSRSVKWNARWNEFCANPIFGVGFAQIDPYMGDKYDTQTGTVEPGTSWGAALSMTGLCGFLCLLYIFGNNFLRNCKSASKESFFLNALIVFFAIHLLVEGYVYAVGSILCFILWLSLTQACKYINN